MFTKKTVRDVDLAGKTVLLRSDFNVPINEFGAISDDYRIKQALPTIKYILAQEGARLVICSHLGRPKSADDVSASLAPVAVRLSDLLGKEVLFVGDCVGDEVRLKVDELPAGGVLLLENLRYHEEEELNDDTFAKDLVDSTKAQMFVQDGFGVVHRAHASTEAITKHVESVAGLLLEREVDQITKVMEQPERPLVSIIGGAKISDKIEVLERLIDISDVVVVVGAMANTFLKALGFGVGKSLVEDEKLEYARDLLEKAQEKERSARFRFLLPCDAVVSTAIDGSKPTRIVDLSSGSLAATMSYPAVPGRQQLEVGQEESIFDVGPLTAERIAGLVALAKTVVWNGAAGVTEAAGLNGSDAPFSHSSMRILKSLEGDLPGLKMRPFTVVGGGDTVGFVMSNAKLDEQTGMPSGLSHVSTGGGASLELMSGKKLPGVEALADK